MPTLDEWGQSAEKRPGLTLLGATVVVVLIGLVVAAIVGLATTGSVFFQGAAAKRTVSARTNVKVFSPENKIAQIAFFHDTCRTAVAQLRIVKNNEARQRADLRAAHFARDPVRQEQASQSLVQDDQDVNGAENALVATVENYNSRSAQSTANVFKGANLPDRIVLPDPITPTTTIDCG